VLCYFEGLTHAQAADRLGWPVGSVAGRLARARALLGRRLTRRGIALPAAGLTAALGGPATGACVTAAVRAALGQATAPPHVTLLAREVSHAMTGTRRSLTATALLGLVVAAVTAFAGADPPAPADEPAPKEKTEKAKGKNEFVVVGKVVDETGKNPIEGVEITASAGNGTLRPTGKATTDKDGTFRLVFRPGLMMQGGKVGLQSAVVHARKPGYYSWTYGWPAEYVLTDEPLPKEQQPGSKRTNLTPGEKTRLEFRMAPAAKLRARLVDGAGKPMAKARVYLTGKNLYPASSVLASGETDAEGVFTAADVPLSRYRLVLEERGEGRRELELGSIDFDAAVEYTAEATVHSWKPTLTHVTFKVTRPAPPAQ
jgi:hypothetical protein